MEPVPRDISLIERSGGPGWSLPSHRCIRGEKDRMPISGPLDPIRRMCPRHAAGSGRARYSAPTEYNNTDSKHSSQYSLKQRRVRLK